MSSDKQTDSSHSIPARTQDWSSQEFQAWKPRGLWGHGSRMFLKNNFFSRHLLHVMHEMYEIDKEEVTPPLVRACIFQLVALISEHSCHHRSEEIKSLINFRIIILQNPNSMKSSHYV